MSQTGSRPPRRFTELVHDPGDGARPPITPGSWVVVSDRHGERPLELARVTGGPEYVHQAGHAIGEVWQLHDGTRRNHQDLTRLDLVDVLDDARQALRDLHMARRPPGQEAVILRVRRAGSLARRFLATADPRGDYRPLAALVDLDQAIADAEAALQAMVRTHLPNLARCLHDAGALWAARDPDWTPGDPARPHPRWPATAGKERP